MPFLPLPVARAGLIAAVGCAVLAGSCIEAGPPTAIVPERISPEYLTGDALLALDGNGRFILPAPERNGREEEIDQARAEQIAGAFVSTYAGFRRHEYEELHGAPIDLERLRPCGRRVFAVTPYEPLDETVPYVVRKAVGSHWLMTFCQRGRPTLSVSVPALSADVAIVEARIMTPPGSGSGLHSFGIPPGFRSVPISPEAAAYHAATVTGRRVSQLPRLMMRPGPTAPQSALWLVTLERPVELRGSLTGESSVSDVVIVGHDFGWTPPTLFRVRSGSEDPPVDSLLFVTDSGTIAPVALHAKPRMPSSVETAVVQ